MTKVKGTPIPEDFTPNESTLAWLARRYPQVDVELATERFTAWACNHEYLSHQKTFQNFIIREDDDGKLKRMFKRVTPVSQQPVDDERVKLANIAARLGLEPQMSRSLPDYRKYIEANSKPVSTLKRFG